MQVSTASGLAGTLRYIHIRTSEITISLKLGLNYFSFKICGRHATIIGLPFVWYTLITQKDRTDEAGTMHRIPNSIPPLFI